MPSFDVVSRVEMQEVDNAISNSMKEIGQDNKSIMLDIGFSEEQIKELENKGVLL